MPVSISIDVEPDLHTGRFLGVTKGLERFLIILNKFKIKGTFFVTCDCIEKYPEIFKKIRKQGHELSLHGYRHERIDELSLKQKKEDLDKSLRCFRKHLGINPYGFRAPQHSIDEEMIYLLNKSKFEYDSSLIPWNLYHILFPWKIKLNKRHLFHKMSPHEFNHILEIPISSFLLPFSSLILRIFPKFLLKIYLQGILLKRNGIFLSHSWDFIEIPESKLYNLCPLDKFLENFEYMLNYLDKKTDFIKIQEITTTLN